MAKDEYVVQTGPTKQSVVLHTTFEVPDWLWRQMPYQIYSTRRGPAHLGYKYHFELRVSAGESVPGVQLLLRGLMDDFVAGKLRP